MSFRAVLDYALAADKQPELVAGNMAGQDAASLGREFSVWQGFNERVRRPVFHSSLSAAPSERLTRELWQTLAQAYLERLGHGDCAWVAIRHGDARHDHVHIIASRIDSQGRRIDDYLSWLRVAGIVHDLERELGLQQLPHDAARASPTRRQLERFARSGQISFAARLQEHLDLAARDKPTVSLFVDRLEAMGIHVQPNFGAAGRVNGISFAREGAPIRGSRLGRAYSWPGLLAHQSLAYDAERDLSRLLEASARAPAPAAHAAGRAGPPGGEKMPPLANPSRAYRAGAAFAARVEIYVRHEQLSKLHQEAAERVQAGEKLLQDRDRLRHDLARREQAFARQLGEVFEQPRTAARRLSELVDRHGRHGHERAGQVLAGHPESLGSLRGVGLAALHSSARRGALAVARQAGLQLAGIGQLRSEISALDARIDAMAPAVVAARQQFTAIARARGLLPTPASMRAEVARAAELLGPGVVRAMSLAAADWVARILRDVGQAHRDLLLARGRDDDGLSP